MNPLKLKIGVMGSASGDIVSNEANMQKSFEVGQWIARNDCIMINGACPGLPHAAAQGCKAEGGFVMGISPAFSSHEHKHDYKSPVGVYDIVLYSGMGFMERDILNIRASDGLVFLGGGIGTLNEFTIAYEEGKPIGVLLDSGGISNYLKDIVQWCGREVHDNMIFTGDPKELITRLIYKIHEFPTPVHQDGRVKDVKFGKHRG